VLVLNAARRFRHYAEQSALQKEVNAEVRRFSLLSGAPHPCAAGRAGRRAAPASRRAAHRAPAALTRRPHPRQRVKTVHDDTTARNLQVVEELVAAGKSGARAGSVSITDEQLAGAARGAPRLPGLALTRRARALTAPQRCAPTARCKRWSCWAASSRS